MEVAAIHIPGSITPTFFGISASTRDKNGINIPLNDDKLIELKRHLGINSNKKY